MASFTKSAQQWATFARTWYLLDGWMQPPGKLAAIASVRLEGKHKPIYHALSDLGDHVVIINTRHIAFSGNKWEQKVYSSHTGYPGGFLQLTAAQLHKKDPTAEGIHKDVGYYWPVRNVQDKRKAAETYWFFTAFGKGLRTFQSVQMIVENRRSWFFHILVVLTVINVTWTYSHISTIVKLAIYGMLPKNLHRRTMMQRLHLFPDNVIPEDIRKNLVEELPQPRIVPRKLSEYTQEEIDAFPKIWTPPDDFRPT